jgi:[FeFe] hydrogenase H-cluster maturation GTPase HydF
MYKTPLSGRLHIAIFGRRNVGKSSLINAITNQEIAIVSDVAGTTTDPVYKSMEILPIGPCVIIDTAGIDDIGALGEKRVGKTLKVLNKTDVAILVIDPQLGINEYERKLLNHINKRKIPALGVVNKIDISSVNEQLRNEISALKIPYLEVSAKNRIGIDLLKQKIIEIAPPDWEAPTILGDLVRPKDLVVLVVPIDLEAPKGRLILPQVQTLRDLLDHNACAVVVKETELKSALASLRTKPRLVVTDSQAFKKVTEDTPLDIPLTSFSILYARYKGDLKILIDGVMAIKNLKRGDAVLIAEACTHHPIGDDIGRVKIPKLLKETVGGEIKITVTAGYDFPANLNEYKLVIHCGGCMLNRREMLSRIRIAQSAGVSITNYGLTIAYLNNTLERALAPFNLEMDAIPRVSPP